jgi:hypothetical protein
MKKIILAALVVVLMAGGSAWAAEAATATAASATAPAAAGRVMTMTDLLAALPAQTQTFFAVSDVGDVALKMIRFQQKTGIKLPMADESISQLIDLKVGVKGGVAQRGAAGVAYLDAEDFKGRNAVFLVPIQGQNEFVDYNGAEVVEKGIYQLPSTTLSRFFVVRDGYALFSDSLRTVKAVKAGAFGPALTEEQRKAVTGSDVYLHVDMRRPAAARESSADRFKRATQAKIVGEPTLESYSDLLLGYLTAVNEVFEQLEAVDVGVRLGPEAIAATALVRFTADGAIHHHLLDVGSSYGSLITDLPLERPFISAGGVSLRSDMLRLAAVQGLDFVTGNSPQMAEKLAKTTREELLTSAGAVLKQVTGEASFMSALPQSPEQGAEASLTVVRLTDSKAFVDARGQLLAALEKVSSDVGSRVTLAYKPDQETYRGVSIGYLQPRIAHDTKEFEKQFEDRAKAVYGPDGFLYRMAIVKDRLIITVGSDLSLFHAALDRALDNKLPPVSAAVEQARADLPQGRNVEYYTSLPAMLSRVFLLSGTAQGATATGTVHYDAEDRKFIESRLLVGVALGLDGGRIRLDTNLGYESLGKAVAFADRHLPAAEAEVGPTGPTAEPGTSSATSAAPATPAASAVAPKPSPSPAGPSPEPR